ncbi:uncharacterized protein LOC131004758 isoform X1 [Salvia miltiorrhiza]|uniref:uncharacterized protein LOC131004758 isoform X1 n=1 Tax=Salvia miltiorrhiza TaxID=226208 RepID=UPI0025AC2846|nr:uncharacterized protein LOC131004758 isoform X1 [Salvia miltiorrhiza]
MQLKTGKKSLLALVLLLCLWIMGRIGSCKLWLNLMVIKERSYIDRERVPKAYAHGVDGSHPTMERRSSPISLLYIGKILLAFLLLFVIGAVFTLFLENLPQIILYINSSI